MPQLINYLDKSGREKQRDITSIVSFDSSMVLNEILYIYFEQRKPFSEVTAWLDENHFKWRLREPQLRESNYPSIRLYVSFDETDHVYQKLIRYLKNSDGSMKIPSVIFYYTPLTDTMKCECQNKLRSWTEFCEMEAAAN